MSPLNAETHMNAFAARRQALVARHCHCHDDNGSCFSRYAFSEAGDDHASIKSSGVTLEDETIYIATSKRDLFDFEEDDATECSEDDSIDIPREIAICVRLEDDDDFPESPVQPEEPRPEMPLPSPTKNSRKSRKAGVKSLTRLLRKAIPSLHRHKDMDESFRTYATETSAEF